MQKVVSHTTRQPRSGERNGVEYYFSAVEELFAAEDVNNVGAQTQIGENYYWTTRDEIQDKDFYIIDPEGLENLRQNIGDNVRIVEIYITAPCRSLRQRAILRDPAGEAKYLTKCMAENTQFAAYELAQTYDYCVHNVHFESALQQLITIVNYEKGNMYAI
jgi:guanylate kinase